MSSLTSFHFIVSQIKFILHHPFYQIHHDYLQYLFVTSCCQGTLANWWPAGHVMSQVPRHSHVDRILLNRRACQFVLQVFAEMAYVMGSYYDCCCLWRNRTYDMCINPTNQPWWGSPATPTVCIGSQHPEPVTISYCLYFACMHSIMEFVGCSFIICHI
jgi:hypothetical protein